MRNNRDKMWENVKWWLSRCFRIDQDGRTIEKYIIVYYLGKIRCRPRVEPVQNNVPSYYDYGFLNYDYLSCEFCVINYENYENQSLWIIHLWHENWNIAREMKVDSIDVIRRAQPSISHVSLSAVVCLQVRINIIHYYTIISILNALHEYVRRG